MILIIDDDIAVRTSLLLLLKNEGFEAAASDNPEEALNIVDRNNPDLIIVDLNFSLDTSGEEGMALLKLIKQRNVCILIILITGCVRIHLAVEAMKLDARHFIQHAW